MSTNKTLQVVAACDSVKGKVGLAIIAALKGQRTSCLNASTLCEPTDC